MRRVACTPFWLCFFMKMLQLNCSRVPPLSKQVRTVRLSYSLKRCLHPNHFPVLVPGSRHLLSHICPLKGKTMPGTTLRIASSPLAKPEPPKLWLELPVWGEGTGQLNQLLISWDGYGLIGIKSSIHLIWLESLVRSFASAFQF